MEIVDGCGSVIGLSDMTIVENLPEKTSKQLGENEIHIRPRSWKVAYCGFVKRRSALGEEPTCIVCIEMHRDRCRAHGCKPRW